MNDLVTALQERFGDTLQVGPAALGQVTAEITAEHLLKVCRALRDEQQFRFEQLSDLCGLDYSAYGRGDWETESATRTGYSRGVQSGDAAPALESVPAGGRPAVVYHLLSLQHNRRLRLRCPAPGEPPRLPSVVDIWNCANWYEREAFDLFGILFTGHPDLRRLLTDYGFIGHPFRKDFPLHGKVEVRYDPTRERVVYQPVTIENRVLVPRVVRRDNRYLQDAAPPPPELDPETAADARPGSGPRKPGPA